MKKALKVTLRIIVSPAVYVLLLIAYNISCIKRLVLFLRYGGEWINYHKNEKIMIQDVYEELKDKKTNNLWQACPLCWGYDNHHVNQIMGTTNYRNCPVCNGKKIISNVTGKPPM